MEAMRVFLLLGLVFGGTQAFNTAVAPTTSGSAAKSTPRNDLLQLKVPKAEDKPTAKPALLFPSVLETTTEDQTSSTTRTSLAPGHTSFPASPTAPITSYPPTTSTVTDGTSSSAALPTTTSDTAPNTKSSDRPTSSARTTDTTTQAATRTASDIPTVNVSLTSPHPHPSETSTIPFINLTVTSTSPSSTGETGTTSSNLTTTSTSKSSSETTPNESNSTETSTFQSSSSETATTSIPTTTPPPPSFSETTPSPNNLTTARTSLISSGEMTSSSTTTTATQTEQTSVTAAPSATAGEDRVEVLTPVQKKKGLSRDGIIATSICVAVLVMAVVVLGLWFYNVKWKLHRRDGPLLREPDNQSVTGKSYSSVQYYNDGADSVKLRDV